MPVLELVHSTSHVFGEVFITDVEIIIILRNKVHIMEEEAVPVLVLQDFSDANVKELCSVKCGISSLEENMCSYSLAKSWSTAM